MKKLLLCATDAGGARNISFLLLYVQNKGFIPLLVTSEEMLTLFDTRGIKVIESKDVNSEVAAIELLKEISPAAMVCGTTRYQSPERLLIIAAKKLGIRSIVLLDEWFNYAFRFGKENGRFRYLPDIICCQDEKARQDAIEEGIPAEVLFITGSLYLTNLIDEAKAFLKRPPLIPDYLAGCAHPIITFLSETHSVDYGAAIGEKGPSGKFIGYSEHTVRSDIFDALKRIQAACTVIEKLHPSDKGSYEPLNNKFIRWHIVREARLWPLLWHSDLVIGMRSMALMEAAILGCPTISYQPHLIGPQLCSAAHFNLVKCIYNDEELCSWIEENIGKKPNRQCAFIKEFPFIRNDVAQNIIDLIVRDGK